MRIIRLTHGERCEFRVYPARDQPVDVVAPLVRHLRQQRLPFLVGGTVDDRALLLTIGPLSGAEATDFARQWSLYLE